MKQCRIMITKKCNLRCPYCLMKNKDIMKTVKPTTIDELFQNKYKTYLITGGEPLYNKETENIIVIITSKIMKKSEAPIYLYTNGINIALNNIEWLSKIFDGINISLHHKEIDYNKLLIIDSFVPIRIHRRDILVNNKLIKFCKFNGIPLKIWVKDKCETEEEDRFILTP